MTKYGILDLETTGFIPKEEQITEVGIVITDFNGYEEKFESFVALEEGRVISDKIKEITGITEETLVGAPTWSELVPIIKEKLKDCVIVAQFASFDLSFLQDDMTPSEFYCTRTLNRLRWPEHNASLRPTCQRLGIPLRSANREGDDPHGALQDAEATTILFKTHLDELGEGVLEYKNVMAEGSDRPLNYIPENAKVVHYESHKEEKQNG